MQDDLISLNLTENILRIAKARNEGGKINAEVLFQQFNAPSYYDSETKKVTDETINLIKKSLDTLKLNRKAVNIVVPDGFTYSQIVSMPRLKEKELLTAIKYQADQFIPMPIDETSLDLEILNEDKVNNTCLVLIIAAPQKQVDRIQTLAEQVGLYPESIENELSATGRFLENFYNPASPAGGSVFVNLGYSYTSFYYFDHKLRLIIDSHSFPAGFSVFLREAQVDVNIDQLKAKEMLKRIGFLKSNEVDFDQILRPAVDALSSELQKFIVSVRTKYQNASISQIYLYNQALNINQLDKKLSQIVAIPTVLYDPISSTKRTPAAESYSKELSAFVACIGGSIR